MKKKQIVYLLGLLILILVVGCEPEPWEKHEFMNTRDANALRPVLFKPGDLSWTSGTYTELTQDLFVATDWVPFEDYMIAAYKTKPPSKHAESNLYGCYQDIFLYSDEETAIQSFEQELERFISSLKPMPDSVVFEGQLNLAVTGCRDAWSDIGAYKTCEFMAQHGPFLTKASMNIDDQIIQMQYWEDLINAIQDRLVAQVEQESSE